MPGPQPELPTAPANVPADQVILLNDDHDVIGEAPRASVHTQQTPLHLAFSCYVFNEAGEVLLTRRALSKRTWPGVWTNTCCGHPRPGEDMVAAIRRRLADELRREVDELLCVLPDFAYTATDASGIMDWEWVKWDSLAESARLRPFIVSPGAVQQVDLLRQPQRQTG